MIDQFTEVQVSNVELSDVQTKVKSPNMQQKQAIEADADANVRVLAGPGSGKTFVIEHRYKHLVDNGIDPRNILVVTFSKSMADEMAKRVQKTCPSAVTDQISTIHAFCYRVLTRWYPDSKYYRWQVPKDWQVKKAIEDITSLVWKEKEKPNASRILKFVNASKHAGLTADESYSLYCEWLGFKYGEWIYDIRCKFDAWLNKNRFLLFADMLYLVEQQVIKDENFRGRLQQRFTHVIVDEAQDTNKQAMRILIIISLQPGQNTICESKVVK